MAGRPEQGVGHYLRDLVYGALDGSITTLAVVAGVAGAALDVRVAWILGLANLVADGISMGASNYLGLKSELLQRGASVEEEMPWRHGLATFFAFLVAGAVPLLAFGLTPSNGLRLPVAAMVAAVMFFVMGAARAPFVSRSRARCGMEMLALGVVAGAAAFGVGALADALV